MSIPISDWVRPGKLASRAVDDIRSKGIIPADPFRSLPASEEALGGNWAQLLGIYEIQLHEIIESLLQRKHDLIIDVGGGSGYYAVGLALRQQAVRVLVFESEPEKRVVISRYAGRSGVAARIDIRGHCKMEELLAAINEERHGLLLMDCEGGERMLLGDELLSVLRGWCILVELHDWHAPGSAEEIHHRF